jgi:hypothetical protein
MRIARELEQRIERLVDGISAAIFRGRMHPVDLANRLVRQVDMTVTDGPAGPEIAPAYVVAVHPRELTDTIDVAALERELAHAVAATAAERGWRTGGTVTVELRHDPTVAAGSIRVVPESPSDATLAPWGQLIDPATGHAYDLADNRIRLGRATDNDVAIPDPMVSRHHALVVREAGQVWISDLRSANGTTVNGIRVAGDPASLDPGDAVALGPATFTYRVL